MQFQSDFTLRKLSGVLASNIGFVWLFSYCNKLIVGGLYFYEDKKFNTVSVLLPGLVKSQRRFNILAMNRLSIARCYYLFSNFKI
jgi:hypothetical protein